MRRKRRTAETLRRAVDCLPERTRRAMLQAVEADSIIAGAYTAPNGGVCPMLAAHRRGGRTDLASFARAWDRYTGAKRARPATKHEVRALSAMLEASLIASDAVQTDLTLAVAQVKRERTQWAEAEAAAAEAAAKVEAAAAVEAERRHRRTGVGRAISVNPAAQARRAMALRAEQQHDELEATPSPAKPKRRRRTGETDRAPELRRRGGWAWTRPVRRLDAYEAAVERAQREADDRAVTPA